ncbi:MAG: class II aldolase/adducin family protein [Gammaproteobacteria bacterium]
MTEQEGVIKYDLVFHEADPVIDHDFTSLTRWHRRFKQAGILGQCPERYDGLGFGNISERMDEFCFLISGTQTGHLVNLAPADYALVTHADVSRNRIEAKGQVKPSSETLTHAAVYALDTNIRFVFHVHSPDIWNQRAVLCLPQTGADIAYGTADMAIEMNRLYQQGAFHNKKVLAMVGHEDGIIGFGCTGDETGEAIMSLLAYLEVKSASTDFTAQYF